MPYQNLSSTLSPAEVDEIKAAINTIKAKLPFLITLTAEERQRLFKMGSKSLSFVSNSLTACKNNPQILPVDFNIDEFDRDYQLATNLHEILTLLQQLSEQVDDTLLAVGSEAMNTSLSVYDYVKTAARRTPGLKSLAEQLGERFKGLGPKKGRTDRSTGQPSNPPDSSTPTPA